MENKISKQTAKQIFLNYQQLEQAKEAIQIISENIEKLGTDFKLEDGINERFSLTIPTENGSNRVIGTSPNLALKVAKKVKKHCEKQFKPLRNICLKELAMPENEKGKLITKELSLKIHNQYYSISDAQKLKDTILKKMENKEELKMQLRDGYFSSRVELSIPMSYNSSDIHSIQSDISVEILENYIQNNIKTLENLNEEAKIQLLSLLP